MALDITAVTTGPVAEITLSGLLDRTEAPRFGRELAAALRIPGLAQELAAALGMPAAEFAAGVTGAPRPQQEPAGGPAGPPGDLVLRVRGLVSVASIAIRMLLLALKRAPGLTIYVIAPQELVEQTLRRTGLDRDRRVVIQDEYPAAG